MTAHPFRTVLVAVILSVPATLAAPAPAGAADAYQPARCAWMAPFLAEFGLPVATFQRIAWRESGCAFRAPCVATRTDLACSRFGLNFKGSMARYWRQLCGARSHLDTRYFHIDMTCARKAYERLGLAPWQ